MANFQIFFECLKGMLLEAHSVSALVTVDSVFSGQYLTDGKRPFFSPSFFVGVILSDPGWKGVSLLNLSY